MKVVIIGAGLAGLAASDALAAAGQEVEVFEANPYWGGRTHSIDENGFVFDQGPHVSFTTNQAVQDVFTRGAGSSRRILSPHHECLPRTLDYPSGSMPPLRP